MQKEENEKKSFNKKPETAFLFPPFNYTSMQKNTESTFILRGINPQEILRKYLNGDYDNLDLPNLKPKINKNKNNKHVQEVGVGTNPYDPIYEKNINGSTYRVYTTNSAIFKNYFSSIKDVNEKIETKTSTKNTNIIHFCDHCLQQIEGDVLVVPTAEEIRDGVTYYYGEYVAGHGSCALALIRDEIRKNPLASHYKNAEQRLKHIITKLGIAYPRYPAPGRKALIENGGAMTKDIYYNGEKDFRKDQSMIFLPIKAQWETKI